MSPPSPQVLIDRRDHAHSRNRDQEQRARVVDPDHAALAGQWAIYKAAHWAGENNTRVTALVVNGRDYPRYRAEKAIRKATVGGLAYARGPALAALAGLQ